MKRSEKSERSSFFIPKGALTHHPNGVWAVVLAVGKPCALAEGSSNSLCSFAVNSDGFVILQNNAPIKSDISVFHTLSEF